MIIVDRFVLRARWFSSAGGAIILLLQRTPVVRCFLAAESAWIAPAAGVLRSALPAAAALGAVHSLAGATTQLVASVGQPAKATVGTPFSEAVVIQGVGVSFAQSWTISNTLPPGVAAQGAVLQSGRLVINPSSGTLLFTGTPTAAGTYNISVSGYQFTNLSGPVTSATASIVVSPAPNSAPAITRAPSNVTAIAGGSTTLSISFTGTPAPTFQWLKNGVPIAGATSSSLVLSNLSPTDAGSYAVTLTNSLGSTTSAAGTLTVSPAPVAPAFASQPVSQVVTAGGDVALTVAVTGTPTPVLQWLKNGVRIDGVSDATLALTNVQASDAGTYTVQASNASGFIVSAPITLTVNPAASMPVFTAAPASQAVGAGSTVVFSAPAIGAPAPTYQWKHDGVDVPNATGPVLVIKNASAVDAGEYTSIASNALGSQTAPAAMLAVSQVAATDLGRLANLSILTATGPGAKVLTMGAVVAGANTVGSLPLVIRGVGPTLGAFGIAGVLTDPVLTVTAANTGSIVGTNDNWGGTAALVSAFNAVGAFLLPDTSLDSALASSLAVGNYSIQVTGKGATGQVIAEIYDAAGSTRTATTPRLINLSTLTKIDPGGSLAMGFVIGGTTARTVLVRSVGPTLGTAFALPAVMADPKLELFNNTTSEKITDNDNWGGSASLTAAMASVGAFVLDGPASKDAVILITLPPGAYSAQVSGADGGGGTAIVEVYEVP